MRRTNGRRGQRGFALLVVIIIAALVALLASSLMQLVSSDLSQVGQSRRAFEARDTAEGGVSEILNDLDFVSRYPGLAGTSLSVDYDTSGSRVVDPNTRKTYNGSVRLLRVGPPTESSLEQTRVITYEVRALANVNNGAAQTEVVAEVLRTIAYPRGWTPEEQHYR